jgi:hypothetical protein
VPMKIKLNFFYQICDGKRVDTCAVFNSWILAYVLTCKSWMLEFWNTEFLSKVLTCRVIGRGGWMAPVQQLFTDDTQMTWYPPWCELLQLLLWEVT